MPASQVIAQHSYYGFEFRMQVPVNPIHCSGNFQD